MITLSRTPMWNHKAAVNPLDVTVKSAKSLGRNFAPTWAMVMGHKSGILTNDNYTIQYLEKLDRLYWPPLLEKLQKSEHITFLCYCKDDDFCHTYLLIDYLIEHFPDTFKKLGE